MGLRGGGKRAAAAIAKEDTLSKEEKINLKTAELQLTLIQLNNLKNAFASPIASHIEKSLTQGKTVIDESLYHIPIPNLQKLVSISASSNGETYRTDFLAKFIFAGDYERIDNMNKAMKLCDVAIKTITLIKFYENYMTKTGRLSWEAYKDKLEEVPTFHTPLWNYSLLL